ncbi:MAG: GTPase Era [Candidatus Omnitrophica bacterium]|nr:GTPase Era [Candidatus Omnitrophota bacterium]MBU4589659.1 GTPase Era [Candidatus Omnitrophota bacterium]
MFKAGKVAIIGRPNVGKSTLINALIKEKLCIVSQKPETTRDNIQGIISGKDFQVVFIDTPGMHKPKNLLGKSMVRRASSTFLEVDIVLALIDSYSGITQEDKRIFSELPSQKINFLVINKIDNINKCQVLPIIERAQKYSFKEIIPISAKKLDGTDIVFKKILEYLPEGFPMFPEDQLSDKNERFLVQELIREKVLEVTRQEIPHSIAVGIEEMKDRKDKDIYYIRANIYVEKDSQKAIVIGKKGRMLKKIGENSRKEIESFLKKKVFLDLWVKVYENWRKDPFALKNLGY